MPRILAIDYGTKRSGIAVTDPEQIIATSLAAVNTSDLIPFLKDYISRENVERIIVGAPVTMSGKPSSIAGTTDDLVKKLEKTFSNIAISRADERFTSLIAQRTIRDAGIKKKARRNKQLVDKVSAVLILQSYLDNPNCLA